MWGEEERASKKCEKNKEGGGVFKNGEERKERKERKAERMWEGEMREKDVGENVNENENENKNKKQSKTFSTRASHVVTHRTTSLARIILTSEIGRDRVFYD